MIRVATSYFFYKKIIRMSDVSRYWASEVEEMKISVGGYSLGDEFFKLLGSDGSGPVAVGTDVRGPSYKLGGQAEAQLETGGPC
jgi:hypothetical protein